MSKEQTRRLLEDSARHFDKNAGIFRHNILNLTEQLVRCALGGSFRTELTTPQGGRATLRVTSRPHTPDKHRDQTFHTLDIEIDHGDGPRDMPHGLLDTVTVLHLYDAARAAACATLEDPE